MYQPTSFTLREILLRSAEEFAALPAVGFVDGAIYTFAQFKANAKHAAVRLRALGLGPGDRAAILSENRPEWGMAYFGTAAAGMVVVPILTDFGTAQIANILAHSGCKAVFASAKLESKLAEAMALMPATDSAAAVIRIEELTAQPAASISGDSTLANDTSLADDDSLFPPISEEALAAIIYTSGTTGFSKGVMLTHRNVVWNAWAIRSIIVLRPRDVLLSILPLAHTYECTLGFIAPIMQGSRILYLDRPPSASALLPALNKVRPTIMNSVPLVIEKIYRTSVLPKLTAMNLYKLPLFRGLLERLAGAKLKSVFGGRLRFFGVGGAALAPDVEAFLARIKFPYAIGYGLTETAPLLAGSAPYRTYLRTTGPALRGVELRIADPHPETGEGEIQARGPNVMVGYWNDPDKTAEVFTSDGWFRTGDLGRFDRRGRLSIRGRLKTMILGASGENIYPEEIEAVLNQHDIVLDSLVYQDDAGLVALVQLKPETLDAVGDVLHGRLVDMEHRATDLLERVRKEANARLSAWSRIARVVLQKEPFEKTPTQKIKRFLYGKRHNGRA